MLALNDQLLSHLFTDVDIHGHEEEDDSINACEPSSHGSTSTSTHPGKGPHETNKSKSPLVHLLHGALAFTFLAGIIAGYHCIVNNGISNGNDSDGNDNDHDHGAMNMILGLKHFPFEILHAAETDTETATLHGYHSYFQFHHQDPSAQQQQQQDMTESSPMDRFPFTVAALGVISCIFLYDTVRHYWNRRNLYKYK